MVDFMLMLLGKGFICAGCTLLTYVIVDQQYPLVQQPLIPAMCILCYSYVVASLFITIFSFSARTILHCFLLDEENGGSKDTPQCLKAFLDYCDENNKANEEKEGGNRTGSQGGEAKNVE